MSYRFVKGNLSSHHLRLSAKKKKNRGQNLRAWRVRAIKEAVAASESEGAATSTEALEAIAEAGASTTQVECSSTLTESISTEAGVSNAQPDAASTKAGASSIQADAASTKAGASSIQADAASTKAGASSIQADAASTEAGASSIQADAASTEARPSSIQLDTASTEAGASNIQMDAASAFRTQTDAASMQGSRDIKFIANLPSKKIYGRRIIDVNFFVTQLVKLNKHSKFGCDISDLMIISEEKDNFMSSFLFKCRMCNFQEKVWTENPKKRQSINSDALDGLLYTGCGFVNMQNFFTRLQLPTPNADFEKEYGRRLAEEMKAAQKREEKEAKELEKEAKKLEKEAQKRQMVEAKKREKEAKKREMQMAKIRSLEASLFGNNNIVTTEMELSVDGIRNVSLIVPPVIEPLSERINTEHVAESSSRLEGIPETGEMIIPDTEIRSAGVTEVQELQNLVEVIGGGGSTNQHRITHEGVPSKPYVASSAVAPAKQCEGKDLLYCKDTFRHLPNYQGPEMHRKEKSPLFTIASQISAGASDLCTQLPISLPLPTTSLCTITSQPAVGPSDQMPIGLPAQLHPHLETLKLRMVEKKLALNVVIKTSKEIQHLVKLQASAKFQKEHEMKMFEEATARAKALRVNDAGERLFVTDVKNRAWSEAQKALSMEKYAAEALEQAVNKLIVALETLMATMAQEEQALVEFEEALRGIKKNGVVPNSETQQTSDHSQFTTGKYSNESTTIKLDLEHVITGDINSVNKEEMVKQGVLETENNLDSAIVVKEEIEVDDGYSVEGLT